jgi:hypothetical protein
MSIQSTGLSDYERLVVGPGRAAHMLDCGNTRLYELINSGELDSYLDGRARKITVESIRALIARRLESTKGLSNVSPRPRRRTKAPDFGA